MLFTVYEAIFHSLNKIPCLKEKKLSSGMLKDPFKI